MEELYKTLPFDNPDGGAWKQGWNIQIPSEHAKRDLDVFVIPHSHNDPGWLMTYEEYYQRKTKHILSSIVRAASQVQSCKSCSLILCQDPSRHFIWAEIAFFSKWWNEQPETVRETTRQLLARGQLEFVTGGWCRWTEISADTAQGDER